MSEQEFANVDEALDAIVEADSVLTVNACGGEGAGVSETAELILRKGRAREWLRALGTYAQDRQGMMTRREVEREEAECRAEAETCHTEYAYDGGAAMAYGRVLLMDAERSGEDGDA